MTEARAATLGAPKPGNGRGAPRTVGPRPAGPADVPEIIALIHELADYERAADEVRATEADLHALLFGGNTPSGAPAAHCLVIDDPTADTGSPARLAGFALWFLSASTWLGRHGVHLEDLFVRPEHRSRGYGRLLMAELARICVERGYGRLEWSVLDWNAPAIGFYAALGSQPLEGWTTHRLSGADLVGLADRAAPRA